VTKKPRWDADAKVMAAWVIERLEEREALAFAEYAQRVLGGEFDGDPGDHWLVLAYALERAERRDVGPLRKLHPHIARFIHPEPRKRGGSFPRQDEVVLRAVDDVSKIRKIWRDEYEMKSKRGSSTSAEAIAAERWADRWGGSASDLEAAIAEKMKRTPHPKK
jgi:hypothetical protein